MFFYKLLTGQYLSKKLLQKDVYKIQQTSAGILVIHIFIFFRNILSLYFKDKIFDKNILATKTFLII